MFMIHRVFVEKCLERVKKMTRKHDVCAIRFPHGFSTGKKTPERLITPLMTAIHTDSEKRKAGFGNHVPWGWLGKNGDKENIYDEEKQHLPSND